MIQNNRFSNVAYHLVNINDDADLNIHKQHFCEVTDVFCSVATFLDTTDLTRFFSISRTFSSSLSNLPEIKQILLYNRSQKRRNWKLLGKYDYNNHISRQRIKNSGLIGAHYIQKSNEILKKGEFNKNILWSIEGGTHVLMCGVGLFIFSYDCFLFLSSLNNLYNLCLSLSNRFNQTIVCNYNNSTTYLLDTDLPEISLEEQIELKSLNYLTIIPGQRIALDLVCYLFFQPFFTKICFESPMLTNPNLHHIINDFNQWVPKVFFNFINFFLPCINFFPSCFDNKDNLCDSNNNDIFNSILIFQSLNLIDFLNTVIIAKRPYLRKKIIDGATEKINRVFSSISFYEPRLIKKIRYNSVTLGESALIKIKRTFQYIGSYLSCLNRIHGHNN